MRILKLLLLGLVLVYVVPVALSGLLWWMGKHPRSWRDADWSSAHLLPAASASPDAAVYILSARTGGLKGAVSEHSWIVVKEKGATRYDRWDKVGWGAPIRRNAYTPDGRWYSNEPRLVLARTGVEAEALIPSVRAAIAAYPYAASGGYRLFPGPNSNTFVAYVLDHLPGVTTTLPTVSVGRDFPAGRAFASFDGERGDLRLSLFGYAGLTLGGTSGIELNLFGLVAGLDPMRAAVKIPAFGTFSLLPGGA